MIATVEVVLPLFGLILLGWLLGRARVLDAAAVRGLTTFVFYVAIPALLFRNLAGGQSVALADLAVLAAYFGAALAILLAMALAGGAVFGLKGDERIVFGMGASFSNNVQLGIPLILASFGERGLVPLLLIISFHSLLMIGIPTAAMEIVRGRGERVGAVLSTTLKALATNPVIVSLLVGVAWGAAGVPVPALAGSLLALLAAAAIPCCLVALGASLAGYRLAGVLRESAAIAAVKLAAHPLLVWLLASKVLGYRRSGWRWRRSPRRCRPAPTSSSWRSSIRSILRGRPRRCCCRPPLRSSPSRCWSPTSGPSCRDSR